MEPQTGELYTVQQGPGGGVRMAKSSRVREDIYANRRPTHIPEARYLYDTVDVDLQEVEQLSSTTASVGGAANFYYSILLQLSHFNC